MSRYIYSIMLLLMAISIQAQAPHRAGEILLRFQAGVVPSQWLEGKTALAAKISLQEQLTTDWPLFRLRFDPNLVEEAALLQQLRADPAVAAAQFNHILRSRSITPNDPKYTQWQWNLSLLGLPDAWEYSTGGFSAAGDSIVVAVIDGGCDLLHEDLAGNIWYNHQEIAGDSLDNDQNGFVDDVRGWQLSQNNDQHTPDGHGTSVTGIIGAVGDNAIGMAGINWQVKMMIISAAEQDLLLESNIIRAYHYVWAMRRRYRLSQGQEGAFVVAANLSAGVDYGKPADFPLWCALYDSLGQEGILCVGAVMNANENVDAVGDIPSTCPSDFLITVTNTTKYDALDPNAAHGPLHVDLAAPGAVYSTRSNNTYNVFGGTSGAAPHAAAAIALLASYPHADWAAKLKNEPAEAALEMRRLLCFSVDHLSILQGKTSCEGRLNIGKAMKLLDGFYQPTSSNIQVDFGSLNGQALLRFGLASAGDYVWEFFDLSGRLRYRERFSAAQAGTYSIWLDWYWPSHEILLLRLSKADGTRVAVTKVLR